jgi:uncharacterized DUF497 family protein
MEVLPLGGFEFVWDAAKATSNLAKHGVSFIEAATAFFDEFAETIPDLDHSDEEDRFLLLATSTRRRILLVVHVARQSRLRIISARPATPRERRRYEATKFGRR